MPTSEMSGKHVAVLIAAGSAIGLIAALLIPGEINLAYAIVIAAVSGVVVGGVINRYDRRRNPPDQEQ